MATDAGFVTSFNPSSFSSCYAVSELPSTTEVVAMFQTASAYNKAYFYTIATGV
jgi:hypothetical protein